jgi:hypothetical protein
MYLQVEKNIQQQAKEEKVHWVSTKNVRCQYQLICQSAKLNFICFLFI